MLTLIRSVVAGVILAALLAPPSGAGTNLGARASLSFRSDSLVTVAPASVGPILRAYVWIEGGRRIKGAEYTVRWHVAGGDSVLTVLGEKHPSGVACGEYLLRGHAIGVPKENTPNSWGIAFASDEADTTCSTGPISEIMFDASALGGAGIVIQLCDASLLDEAGDEDRISVQGALRVNKGSASLPVACSAPALQILSPRAAPTTGGSEAILTGQFLSGVREVRVGGVPATGVRALDDAHVSLRMPAHAPGVCDVQAVSSDGRMGWVMRGAVFTDAPAPTITTVLPDTAVMGTPLTLQGTGFVERMNVRIGGMLSPRVHVISGTLLTADIPLRRAGAANVRVELPDGQSFDWPGSVYLRASAP